VIAAAKHPSSEAREALASLCDAYWRPVYRFIRCRAGGDADRAADLTQEFFALVLERGYLGQADPDRGRFRNFLLAAVAHFLSNEADRRHAVKRGGRARIVPLEIDDDEGGVPATTRDEETPEKVYERSWALAILEAALARLRAQHSSPERIRWFERLRPHLTGEHPAARHAEIARELGTSEGAVTTRVARLRKEFGELLRDEVAQTVLRDDDVDAELYYLLDVLRR
jgi:RNA polymerase sigma-70 factor (ECF subfamily)